MRTRPSRQALFELLKLHKMVGTCTHCLEEPAVDVRERWDAGTAAYVEELEGIIGALHAQSIDAMWELLGGEGA